MNEYLKVVFTADTKKFLTGLNRVSAEMKRVGQGMESFGRTMSMRVTAPIVAFGVASVKAFGDQEKAEFKLRAALQANGREVNKLFDDYKAFASGLQDVTVVGDETSLAMLQVAENMGLTGESAKRAVRNAIGLSSAFGIATQSAMRYTAMLEQGDTTMLNRYIPTLRSIEDETERVAAAQQILSNGFQTALAEADTFSGQMQQLTNNFGDFQETVGQVVAESLLPFTDTLNRMTLELKALSPEQIRSKVEFAAFAAAIPLVTIALGSLIKNIGILIGVLKTLLKFSRAHPYIALATAIGTLGYTFYSEIKSVRGFVDELERFNNLDIEDKLKGIQMTTDKAGRSFGKYAADLSGANGIFAQMIASILSLTGQTDRYEEVLQDLQKAKYDAIFLDISERMQELSQSSDPGDMVKVNELLNEIAEILVELENAGLEGLKLQFQGVFTAAAAVTRSVREAFDAIEGGRGTATTPTGGEGTESLVDEEGIRENAMNRFTEAAKRANQQVANLNKDVEESVEQLGMWANNLTQLFDSLVFQTSSFGDVLKSVLRQLASQAFLTFLKILAGGGFSAFSGMGLGGFFKQVIGVNDALITSAGDVIKFHPDDNILAMKDLSMLGGGQSVNVVVTGQLRGEDIFLSGTRGGVTYNR